MDTGLGNLAIISEKKAEELEKKDIPVFKEGEILLIKNSKFKIERIKRTKLYLKLLKD